MTSVDERIAGPATTVGDGATVAFLFAAGDTDGDRIAVLRATVEEFGGRLLDATVDSAPSCFLSPSAALACGRALLQRLGDLRIGIHCGEPLAIDDGRFFGAAVWTAARIAGRADPGTILLSGTATALLPPDGRPGLEPIGAARLRGLSDPVPLFEDRRGGSTGETPERGHGTTTVLTIDQVGSTAMLDGLGDSAARGVHAAVMDVAREAIEEHGGVELEYGGDGLSIGFPSALGALDCATAVQRAAARHRRRFPDAGLLLRAAAVSGEADPEAPQWLLVAAAALVKRAEADEVLVSPVTAGLAADRRDHRFTPSVDRDAVLLDWRLREPDRLLPPGLTEPDVFVGREQALDVLTRTWAEAARGPARLVLIDGEAGMGTTALAARFARIVIRQHGTVLFGRASAVEARPLEALAEAVSDVLAATSRADLRRLLGDDAAVLRSLLPVVGDRLPRTPEAEVPEAARAATWAAALGRLVGALAEEAPVLLVLDDLHRASPALVAAIRVVAEAVASRPVLLLGLRRADGTGTTPLDAALEDAADHGVLVSRCTLGGLDPAEAAELVEELVGAAPDRAALDAALTEVGGRPRDVVAFAHASLRSTTTSRPTPFGSGADVDLLAAQVLGSDRPPTTDRGSGVAVDTDTDPYPGLAPFDEAAANRFSGREQLTAELVARVGTGAVTAVVGPSGSGKSSLVRAGLLPALATDVLPGSSAWDVLRMVPGTAPLDALAAALAVRFDGDEAAVRAMLRRGSLQEAIDALAPRALRLLVVVDQAEELFTSASEAERDRFAALLEEAVADAAPLGVVLVLRAEFYGAVAAYPDLAARLERNHVLVRAMTDSELRRAVEAPAVAAGLAIDPALVDAVVADVAGEPGSLPLLSTAMAATWTRRRGRRLTLRAYAETGGVRRAVAQLADTAYSALPEGERPTARALLLRLAQSGGPDGGLDLRRRAPLEEVLGLGPDAAAVLHAFVERRLVIADDTTVEVAHEALLREWPLLRGWLDEDREGRALLQTLAADARTWQAQDRDPSLLYRGARLARATELAAGSEVLLATAEQSFLAASTADASDELARARRTATRFRRLAVGLVLVLVVSLVVTGIAIAQGRAATDSAIAARAAALTAAANALGSTQEDLAGLLALAADRVHPTPAALSAVVTAANRSPDLVRIASPGGAVATAALSSDGQAEAVVSSGGRVTDVSLGSGRRLGGLVVPGATAVTPIAVSAAGLFVAVATSRGVRILDASTGRTASSTLSVPIQMTFLADGTLAVRDETGAPTYLDPSSGARVHLPELPSDGTAAVTADGRTEVWTTQGTSTADNPLFQNFDSLTTKVTDIGSGKQVGAPITGILAGMSEDGRLLAILRDPDLVIIDSGSRKVVRTIRIGTTLTTDQVTVLAPAPAVTFDPKGTTIAYTGIDAGDPVHLVDLASGEQRVEAVPLSHPDVAPAFDASGHVIELTPSGAALFTRPSVAPARPSSSGIARQEDNPAPRVFVAVDTAGTHVAEVVPPAASGGPDRYRIASTTAPGAGPLLVPDAGHRFDDATAAFSGDGRLLATLEWSPASGDGAEVVVWDAATGGRIATIGGLVSIPPSEEALPVSRIAFLGDGEVAAVMPSFRPDSTGQTTTTLDVWRVRAAPGAPVAHADLDETSIAAFSADGRSLATLSEAVLNLWTTRSGHLRTSTPFPADDTYLYSDLRFSADGRVIVAGVSTGQVTRWSVAHPTAQRRVPLSPQDADHAWAVSPDGSTIAEIGPSSVEFRSVTTGRLISEAQSSSSSDRILGFTRDGGAAIVWDGSQLELVDRSGDVAPLGPTRSAPPTTVLDDDPDVVATSTGVLTSVTSGSHLVVQPYDTTRSAATTRICTLAGRDLTTAEWAQYLPGVTPVRLCGAS